MGGQDIHGGTRSIFMGQEDVCGTKQAIFVISVTQLYCPFDARSTKQMGYLDPCYWKDYGPWKEKNPGPRKKAGRRCKGSGGGWWRHGVAKGKGRWHLVDLIPPPRPDLSTFFSAATLQHSQFI